MYDKVLLNIVVVVWWLHQVQHFCDPMDYSPPGSSVHSISQARILDWLPFPSPGDLPDPGIKPASPALTGRFFTIEPPGKPQLNLAVLKFSHYSRKNKQNKQKQKKQAKQSKTIPQVKTKSQYPYPNRVLFESPSIHLHIQSCSQHHFMSCLLLTCYFKLGSQDSIKLSQCPKSFMWSKIFKALLISRKFLEVFLSQEFPDAWYFSSCFTYSEASKVNDNLKKKKALDSYLFLALL